jgi:uncharacterized protein YjhX (UPF0386 family)
MEFTPGEKTVLAQMRVLYKEAGRDQQIKALTMQWPPTHHETYRKAYASLVAKDLVQDSNGQEFRITDAGLKALGVAPVAPQPPQPRVDERPAVQQVQPRTQPKPRGSMLSRLVSGFLGTR